MIEIRYRFEIKKRDDQQLQDEIVALGLIGFIGLCTSAEIVEVLFSTSLLETDAAKLDATVSAHVPDPAAQLKRVRAGAVAVLLTSDDPLSQAVRAAVADLHTRLNDLESARGGRRQAEAEIVTRLVAAIETGAGEP